MAENDPPPRSCVVFIDSSGMKGTNLSNALSSNLANFLIASFRKAQDQDLFAVSAANEPEGLNWADLKSSWAELLRRGQQDQDRQSFGQISVRDVDLALERHRPFQTKGWYILSKIYKGLQFYAYDPRHQTFEWNEGEVVKGSVGVLTHYPHVFRNGRKGNISKTFEGQFIARKSEISEYPVEISELEVFPDTFPRGALRDAKTKSELNVGRYER